MIKTKNTYAFLYHWHQRIGLVMCIAVIAWALSGLAHPIISRLNPKPVAPPPSEVLQLGDLGNFSELIEREEITRIEQLRLFQWQGAPVYRIASEKGLDYFSAQSLERLELGDFDYADYLARHLIGEQEAPLRAVNLVKSFNPEYLYINRFLPVVRLDYQRDDGVSVFIDPSLGRLATIEDHRKTLTGKFFRNLHSWTWIKNITLRRSLMSVFLVLGFVTAAFGLVVYIQSWRMGMFRKSLSAHQHHPRTRRLHRSLGALVAIFAMGFCLSGLLHLWLTDKSDGPQKQVQQAIATQGLELNAELIAAHFAQEQVVDIQLVVINDQAYWRVRKLPNKQSHADHEHHHGAPASQATEDLVVYFNARTGELLADGWRLHGESLALAFTGFKAQAIARVERVESFSGEYGFINKRLPVHAVHFALPGNPTVYVETASNTLASRVVDSKRAEGYTFAYVHKWHFLDFLGKDLRDILMGIVAFSILLTLVLGVFRYFRTRRKRSIHR